MAFGLLLLAGLSAIMALGHVEQASWRTTYTKAAPVCCAITAWLVRTRLAWMEVN